MRVYYSHHPWLEGTPAADYEKERVAHLCKKLIPEGEQEEVIVLSKNNSAPTKEVLEELDTCQTLVFTTVSGMISQSQYNEIVCALNKEKRVYLMYSNVIYLVKDVGYFLGSFVKSLVYDGNLDVYAIMNNMSNGR